jgi:hypothetical protein
MQVVNKQLAQILSTFVKQLSTKLSSTNGRHWLFCAVNIKTQNQQRLDLTDNGI